MSNFPGSLPAQLGAWVTTGNVLAHSEAVLAAGMAMDEGERLATDFADIVRGKVKGATTFPGIADVGAVDLETTKRLARTWIYEYHRLCAALIERGGAEFYHGWLPGHLNLRAALLSSVDEGFMQSEILGWLDALEGMLA
ncbi:MAG: hypothetical protein AB7Q29_15960 [Vicinamibacterales bacterium]